VVAVGNGNMGLVTSATTSLLVRFEGEGAQVPRLTAFGAAGKGGVLSIWLLKFRGIQHHEFVILFYRLIKNGCNKLTATAHGEQ
jgi:hypothetical protein